MTEETKKVFGIGLNKTGTSTLGECATILGLRQTGPDGNLLEDLVRRNDCSRIFAKVRHYDLFQDWPWPLCYEQLDEAFPGSKFILTVRSSPGRWLKSLKSHTERSIPFLRTNKLAYGFHYPHNHEEKFLEFYERHNDNIRSYFSNRENDFIELCWEKGDGFEKLCNFLGCDMPKVPLPHVNQGVTKPIRKRYLWINKVLVGFS